MILRQDTTLESLGVLPGMVCRMAAVPQSVNIMTPDHDNVVVVLSVDAQCEMAQDGAVVVPVLHWMWIEELRAAHPLMLFGTVSKDSRVPMRENGWHIHNCLLVLS